MKTAFFSFLALLLVGCGGRPASGVACKFEPTEFAVEASDSARTLRQCTEQAKEYFAKNSSSTSLWVRHDSFSYCYELEANRAFVDSMEMIYKPYKQLLVNEKELRITYGDSDIKLEFARDTCWLHTYDRYEDYMEHDACDIDIQNFVAHYHYVRLRKMVDKYYSYLFERLKENAESRASVDVERFNALPQMHKLWENLHEEEIDWYYWTSEVIFKKMEQQMCLYYYQTLYHTYYPYFRFRNQADMYKIQK